MAAREKQNFQSYSTFYEKLLNSAQTKIFAKEREILGLKTKIQDLAFDRTVNGVCAIGDMR